MSGEQLIHDSPTKLFLSGHSIFNCIVCGTQNGNAIKPTGNMHLT